MSGWPLVEVSSLCSDIVDCVNRTAPVVDEVTPFRMIRTTNVRDGKIDLSECRYVTKETFERWTRRLSVRDGDVILTREAPIGEVGYISGLGHVFLGQRIMHYRPDPAKIEKRFLFYAFRSPALQSQFGAHDGSGSVVSHIRVADCHRFLIPLPSRDDQISISNLLGALDDKIELNRWMNETLEQMAQAIFKDWFVDFGPVRRKQQGATDPVAIMGGLVQDAPRAVELAALFPEQFDDVGLPVDWRKHALNQVAMQTKGAISPSATPHQIFEHYSLPAYDAGKGPMFDPGATILSNKTPVPPGAVLLSKLNPEIPRVWVPDEKLGHLQIASTEFLVFQPLPMMPRALLEVLFCSPIFRATMAAMVTGTSKSHQRVSPSALLASHALVGSEEVFFAFGRIAQLLLERRLALRAESRTLAETRDYLLPKLMSGEVRVREAEVEMMAVASL